MIEQKSILHRITARSRQNRVLEYVLNSTGKDLKNKKWVFILGCYNSGTTLLNQLLAEHPSIGGLPDEGVMLTTQLVKPEDFGWRRMWWKCEKEMEESKINKNKSAATIKRHWSHFYPPNKDFLLEKSISNICRIPFFEENFQPAYFIHIVRNGYAVAEGIKRKAQIIAGNEFQDSETYSIDLCVNQWVRSLQKIEEEKEKIGNFLELSYEDLTADPQKEVGRITDFLGIGEFAPESFHKAFSVHEKSSQITNMNPKSFAKLSDSEKKVIGSIAGDYLKKYGYQIL